ncbi:hypothetical protein I3842_13G160800 [Carya illinoinensis]|uniref:Uncharacterized protein n=1 Tax=Carya illinoinensis TaxID=32201 RepID=A0A922DEB1_CARIL|nr:hypothetical protein I3842_13G160800 [Carya illinoinensis]
MLESFTCTGLVLGDGVWAWLGFRIINGVERGVAIVMKGSEGGGLRRCNGLLLV